MIKKVRKNEEKKYKDKKKIVKPQNKFQNK